MSLKPVDNSVDNTILQHGLQRTGTNAIRYLLEANYRVSVSARTKHSLPTMSQAGFDGTVISVRDPLSWLASYYPLRKMKVEDRGDVIESIEDLAPEYLRLWREVTTDHLRLLDVFRKASVVQCEMVVLQPQAEASRVASELGLTRRVGEAFEIPVRRLRRGGWDEDVRSLRTVAPLDRKSILAGARASKLPASVKEEAWRTWHQFSDAHPDYANLFNLSHVMENAE